MVKEAQLTPGFNQLGFYERLLRHESLRLTPDTLLSILAAKDGHPQAGTLQYAREVLDQSGGVVNLPGFAETGSESDAVILVPDVLKEGRQAIMAALELYHRLITGEPPVCWHLEEPDEVAYHLLERFDICRHQHKGDGHVGAVFLDPRDRLLRPGIVEVKMEEEQSQKVKGLLKAALLSGAAKCIPFGLFWSHPKSHPDECLGFVEELRKACAEVSIHVPDAVVVHVDAGW